MNNLLLTVKHLLNTIIIFVFTLASFNISAQITDISDFEDLTLNTGTYWNGSATPLGTSFLSAFAIYPNNYDTAYGGYWASGWAYSNVNDSTTSGFSNMYASKALTGNNASRNYGVGQNNAKIYLDSVAIGQTIEGIYITNSTYAYNSMRDGDAYAKKFGGATGSDPDWFKLSISGWFNGSSINDTINFMLADFTFSDSTLDYIVKDWTYVSLATLGAVDSLKFELSSSDNSALGMNTPAFFCVDDFMMKGGITTNNNHITNQDILIYPNPTKDIINIDLTNHYNTILNISLIDMLGNVVYLNKPNNNLLTINLNGLNKGLYNLIITDKYQNHYKSFIKN